MSPSFAGDYIISPPESLPGEISALSVTENLDLSELNANPIYGTDDYSAVLTDEQVSDIVAEGYKVYPNLEVHAFLSESAPQINVTQVWNITVNGINLTGAGQTICLIDSGIDDGGEAFSGGWSSGKILAGRAFFTNGSTHVDQECNATNPFACFDEYGHGTMVAGVLVSNNSTFRGVAPDSNLVIVKVLNGTGNGTVADIVSGLNYCVSSATSHNISVISLSLGTAAERYSGFCDNASGLSLIKDAVDNATLHKISVIVASGNEIGAGLSNNISAPACLFNATPVSSVNKSNAISTWADYWSLPIIFAPGENIYTTNKSGTFVAVSGTSLSTPQVAGVFALMKQYLRLTNQTKTPGELKSLAISTGLILNGNLNNSRIDAFKLYQSLSLGVSILSPSNNSIQNNYLLFINGSSPQDGTNISVFNSTGGIVNSTLVNGTSWLVNFTLIDGSYNITAIVSNGSGTINATVNNMTIDTTNPNLTITSPASNSSINATMVIVNITSRDVNLNYTNISIINLTGGIVSLTSNSTNGNYSIELPVYSDGTYKINATAYDKAGNMNSSSVENLTIRIPTVFEIRPEWSNSYHYGTYTISAGEIENASMSRSLYCNLNQTKSLLVYVNNSGTKTLQNITANIYGFSGLNTSLSWLNGSNAALPINLSADTSLILNLTIVSPNSTFNYTGSGIFLNSSNGEPYTYLNLSMEIVVTNQTLQVINESNRHYYFSSNNLTPINFSAYFYDNHTVDQFLNGTYNATIVNSTNESQQLINLTFNISYGFFSAQLNTTNLSEGNYTMLGNFNDTANNLISINQTFELLQNIWINASTNTSSDNIFKGQNFILRVNVSKNGTGIVEKGTICLTLPSALQNTSSLCQNFTNLSADSSRLNNWTLNGTNYGNYTITSNAYSNDGKYNATLQKNVTIRYGDLDLVWRDSSNPPSSVDPSETFYVKARVVNNGNLAITNLKLDLVYDSYVELVSGSDPAQIGTLDPGEDDTYTWTMSAKSSAGGNSSEIDVSVYSANNATIPSIISRIVDIDTPFQQQAALGAGGGTTSGSNTSSTSASLSFLSPTTSTIGLSQGQNYTLQISVKNNGTKNLTNLYLDVSGLNSSIYQIDSNTKLALSTGNSRNFNVFLSIPADMEMKKYPLVIKAISDQSSWQQPIDLQITGPSVEVTGLENISVAGGENGNFTFKIKNSGYKTITNLSLSLNGISFDKYSITPHEISLLAQNTTQDLQLYLTLPINETIGQNNLVLLLESKDGNFNKSFVLHVLPSLDEKNQIIETYNNISEEFTMSLNKYQASPGSYNATQVDEQLSIANQTIQLINKSLENGDYVEAKRLMAEAQNSLNQLETNLPDIKESSVSSSTFLSIVLLFGVILVAVAVFYFFVPKKDKVSESLFVEPKPKSSPTGSIKSYFSKLSKKSDSEIQREKILEEWRQRYELGKKNKPYGD